MKRMLVLGLALALAACAGRNPKPVEVQTSRDDSLSCVMLKAERDGNKQRVQQLAKEDGEALSRNLLVGTAAATVFPPVALAFDMSNAEEVETAALHDRNTRLEDLRVHNGCVTEHLVPTGYAFHERGTQVYVDSHGRSMTLRTNSYIYGERPLTALSPIPPATQVGVSQITPLY